MSDANDTAVVNNSNADTEKRQQPTPVEAPEGKEDTFTAHRLVFHRPRDRSCDRCLKVAKRTLRCSTCTAILCPVCATDDACLAMATSRQEEHRGGGRQKPAPHKIIQALRNELNGLTLQELVDELSYSSASITDILQRMRKSKLIRCVYVRGRRPARWFLEHNTRIALPRKGASDTAQTDAPKPDLFPLPANYNPHRRARKPDTKFFCRTVPQISPGLTPDIKTEPLSARPVQLEETGNLSLPQYDRKSRQESDPFPTVQQPIFDSHHTARHFTHQGEQSTSIKQRVLPRSNNTPSESAPCGQSLRETKQQRVHHWLAELSPSNPQQTASDTLQTPSDLITQDPRIMRMPQQAMSSAQQSLHSFVYPSSYPTQVPHQIALGFHHDPSHFMTQGTYGAQMSQQPTPAFFYGGHYMGPCFHRRTG